MGPTHASALHRWQVVATGTQHTSAIACCPCDKRALHKLVDVMNTDLAAWAADCPSPWGQELTELTPSRTHVVFWLAHT